VSWEKILVAVELFVRASETESLTIPRIISDNKKAGLWPASRGLAWFIFGKPRQPSKRTPGSCVRLWDLARKSSALSVRSEPEEGSMRKCGAQHTDFFEEFPAWHAE
jgi:hypothetical protein